jgi:2,3-bisphosphoglycerate-dependent phosphoglycerate mutase
MELFLIRHGQSQNNARPREERVEDAPLTEIGHQQCAHLAEWIPSLKLTQVVCSPFLRTLQTADYVSQSLDLKPEVRIELHEQGGCVSGPVPDAPVGQPGMTRSEIRGQYPRYNIAPDIDEDGWWGSKPFETGQAAELRAARLVAQTVEEFAGTSERVAYVMHADIGRQVLLQLDPIPRDVLFNTSVTELKVTGDSCQLEQYNLVAHLPPDLRTF